MLLFGPQGGDEDNYVPLLDLTNTIESGGNLKPFNANQMIDGNGDVITYNEDPGNINKK